MTEPTEVPRKSTHIFPDFEEQVVGALTSLSERLAALEQDVEEMTSVEPEDFETEEEEYPDDGYEDEEEDGPSIQDHVSTIAEGLIMVIDELNEMKERLAALEQTVVIMTSVEMKDIKTEDEN